MGFTAKTHQKSPNAKGSDFLIFTIGLQANANKINPANTNQNALAAINPPITANLPNKPKSPKTKEIIKTTLVGAVSFIILIF